MVWLKIRKHDIFCDPSRNVGKVVVWLKIRKHDIIGKFNANQQAVVVWLKIRKHDIDRATTRGAKPLWFD